MISLDDSSIHFIGKNCWRSNIRSILSTGDKDYYLVKECRSELIGYVPFILKNQLRYGYAVFYVEENKNGFLEFVLSQKSNIFETESKQNLIKLLVKNFLNMLLFSVKVNNFTKLISIKKSKVKFFQYT